MTSVRWDTRQVGALANDLAKIPASAYVKFKDDGDDVSKDLRDGWRANARASAGKTGRLYPNTITNEMDGPLEWVVGPESDRKQGGMGRGFEYGAPSVIRNPSPSGRGGRLGQRVGQTKPHLDGNRAADVEFPRFVLRAGETAYNAVRGGL